MKNINFCFFESPYCIWTNVVHENSKHTKAVIETSVGIFRSYCESKEHVFSEAGKYNDYELFSLLRKFYAEVRIIYKMRKDRPCGSSDCIWTNFVHALSEVS